MDTSIGAKERVTQNRLIGLFKSVLKYSYLGNWEYREGNANVEEDLLSAYLTRRGYSDKEIRSAIVKLKQEGQGLCKNLESHVFPQLWLARLTWGPS